MAKFRYFYIIDFIYNTYCQGLKYIKRQHNKTYILSIILKT